MCVAVLPYCYVAIRPEIRTFDQKFGRNLERSGPHGPGRRGKAWGSFGAKFVFTDRALCVHRSRSPAPIRGGRWSRASGSLRALLRGSLESRIRVSRSSRGPTPVAARAARAAFRVPCLSRGPRVRLPCVSHGSHGPRLPRPVRPGYSDSCASSFCQVSTD